VAGLGDDATLAMLTRTIIQVGHDLGIEVVAEGIERPEHLELLREMGCGLGQGYLIAKPMDARGIEALVGSGWPRDGIAGHSGGGGRHDGDDGRRRDGGSDGHVMAGPPAGGPAGEAEFAPDPGPPCDAALGPGEAPAPASPVTAPVQ
jgi:EAL domain